MDVGVVLGCETQHMRCLGEGGGVVKVRVEK